MRSTFSGKNIRRALRGALLFSLVLATTACANEEDAPQSVFNPAGETSRAPDELWNITFGIAVVVFVLVQGALIFAIVRFRHKEGRKAAQFHGNTKVEVLLTAIPALILAGLAVPTVGTIFDLQGTQPEGAMRIEVIAHQFWWEYRYPDQNIVTANELHIPTGERVVLEIQGATADRVDGTAEVIHSYWIPRLAGTQDVVPGHSNFIQVEADEPGRFMGQCKEYCGLSHANMRIVAYAHSPDDFEQWVEEQSSPAAESGGDAANGAELFAESFPIKSTIVEGGPTEYACGSCHALQTGLEEAQPATGPNLSHFASRGTFAGATFENNEENLANWLRDPAGVRPGSKMPALDLSEDEIRDLVAYLQSLE